LDGLHDLFGSTVTSAISPHDIAGAYLGSALVMEHMCGFNDCDLETTNINAALILTPDCYGEGDGTRNLHEPIDLSDPIGVSALLCTAYDYVGGNGRKTQETNYPYNYFETDQDALHAQVLRGFVNGDGSFTLSQTDGSAKVNGLLRPVLQPAGTSWFNFGSRALHESPNTLVDFSLLNPEPEACSSFPQGLRRDRRLESGKNGPIGPIRGPFEPSLALGQYFLDRVEMDPDGIPFDPDRKLRYCDRDECDLLYRCNDVLDYLLDEYSNEENA